MAERVCQGCGTRPAALLRGFGAKDLVLCPSCRRGRLQPLPQGSEEDKVPAEGPCWVLSGRAYVPASLQVPKPVPAPRHDLPKR